MNPDLPEGWSAAKLNDLVSLALGGDWGADPDALGDDFTKVRVVRGTDFKAWREHKGSSAAERCIKLTSLQKRQLTRGDLVLEVSGGGPHQPVGRTVLIDDEALKRADAPLVCSNFFRLLRLHAEIDPRFINHFLTYAYGRGLFNEFQNETTNLRNLNVTDFLKRTTVRIAPVVEQGRIVEKLEQLLASVDDCQQRLAKVLVLLTRFRQSVLAAACSGRLTADWREDNLNTESAVELLRGFEAQPLSEGGEDIPDTWCWGKFGELVTNYDGKRIPVKQTDRDKRSGPYPYYGAFGVIDDIDEYLYDGEYLLLAEDGKNLESRLRPISLIASGKFWVNNHAHVLQTKGGIPLRFVNAWLNSPTLDLSPFLTGIDQVKLNRAAMDRIPVPIAPLSEQREIVLRMGGLFSLADQLELRLAKARGQVDQLAPSILARAFCGQLVPTEADLARQEGRDYEPASVLLERVQREHVDNATRRNASAGARRAGRIVGSSQRARLSR